jgi:hypothetical protein
MELGYTYAALSDWLHHPDRIGIFKNARARSAAHLAEETLGIADNGADTSAPDAARDKLRIQARQWLASKWDRHTYGEVKAESNTLNMQAIFLQSLRNVQPDNAVVIEAVADPADPAAPPA